MSLATLKTRFTRQQPGNADPAHAFGSEEQLMAEFRRQEYVQPPQRTPNVLTGIRERLANLTARPHETDAPVYSAETYSHESAPDLGWEAAFDPEAAARETPMREAHPAPSAAERFEQFRNTVYSSPNGYRPAPIYEEISFQSAPPRESSYQKPVYEEITFTAPQPRPAPSTIEPPIYEDLTPGPRPTAEPPVYSEYAVPPEAFAEEETPGPYEPVPARRPSVKKGSDFPYAFWSGSILAGVALTLFAFVYACAM